MTKIKIIFANRKDCFEKSGGDTVQMIKTKEYLEKNYPVEIIICLSPEEVLENNDAKIVHIFNLQTINETNDFIKAAKKNGQKTVLSPIHWNYDYAIYVKYLNFLNIQPSSNIFILFKDIVIHIFNFFILTIPFLKKKYSGYLKKGLIKTPYYINNRKKALSEVDYLLPNSPEELEIYSKIFKTSLDNLRSKSLVVPNATDFSKLQASEYSEKTPDDFVLQVGRIEPAKNQINTLKALWHQTQIPIIFVGEFIDKKYGEKLKKLSTKRGNVSFIEYIEPEKLKCVYQNAKVHVLPSFAETTGLVSIEALMSGCQIVVASNEFCPVKYYQFDKYGFICNPFDVKSIRKAILDAWNSPKKIALSEEYLNQFSYENVAKLTYQTYEKLGIE